VNDSNKYKNKNKNNNNNIHDFLSQIKTNSFFFQNELAVFNILETIQNSNERYYIFETVETIQYNELNKYQSSLDQSITIQSTSNYLVRYKNVQFLSLEDVFAYYSNNIRSLRFLINSYTFLLHSVDLLVQNNIIHNNITTSAIGINKNKEPILFHFDVSMVLTPINLHADYLSKYFSCYDPSYYYRPLELHVFSYLVSNNLTSLSIFHIEKIIEEVILNNTFICKFGNNIKLLYEKEGRQYLNNLMNKPLEYITSNIFQYKATWDNYRLSIVYLQLIINTFQLKEKCIQNIIKILLVNIHSNPNLRYSIQKTQDILKKTCYNTNVIDYKKIKLIK